MTRGRQTDGPPFARDLYAPGPTNPYGRYFRGVLRFATLEEARESVSRIDRLYRYFEHIGDRGGMHHAEVVALTGRNRARWSRKPEASQVFMDWLVQH